LRREAPPAAQAAGRKRANGWFRHPAGPARGPAAAGRGWTDRLVAGHRAAPAASRGRASPAAEQPIPIGTHRPFAARRGRTGGFGRPAVGVRRSTMGLQKVFACKRGLQRGSSFLRRRRGARATRLGRRETKPWGAGSGGVASRPGGAGKQGYPCRKASCRLSFQVSHPWWRRLRRVPAEGGLGPGLSGSHRFRSAAPFGLPVHRGKLQC